MTTPAKIEANRKNAQLSTGPQSAEGKAVVCMNAIKHGLAAKHCVIKGQENAQDYESLKSDLVAYYEPHGPIESWLVQRIVICQWRMRRAMQEETRETIQHNDESIYVKPGLLCRSGLLETIIRYETTASRELFRAMGEIERLQAIRLGRDISPSLEIEDTGGFVS